ncbi:MULTISPECIES: SCO family protein [unclassified Rhizobacter]|uniref:SCO family protein n=1 Tax=unclassified Rhizobacter TaxID=2640088 RepID=UPI00138EE904|nr:MULTISPECIES: SCO family protein [unclassified Rhizobacter]
MNGPAPPLAPHRPLWPTLLCCSVLLAHFIGAIARISNGFELWTFESLRRAQAQQGLLQASPLAATLSDGSRRTLWAQGAAPRAFLVDFIYTRCPGICQALGSEYQRMQEELARSEAPVQLLSLSFDTARDDVPALAGYATQHHAAPAQWWIGVPAAADSQRLLGELGVVAVPDGFGGYVHNGAIHLLDGNGRLREVFDYDDWPQALAAAQRLAEAAP